MDVSRSYPVGGNGLDQGQNLNHASVENILSGIYIPQGSAGWTEG